MGVREGLISGGCNELMHVVFGDIKGPGDPKKAKNKQKSSFNFSKHFKVRHLFGPDAVFIAFTQDVTAGGAAGTEIGVLHILNGSDKGIYPVFDYGFGVGGISGSAGFEMVKLYYTGDDVKLNHFLGNRFELNLGAEVLGKLNFTGIFSHLENGNFVFGFGINIGVGFSPHVINGNFNYGKTIQIGKGFKFTK